MSTPPLAEAVFFLVGMYIVLSYAFHGNLFQPHHANKRVVLLTDSTSKFGRLMTLEYAQMKTKLFLVGSDREALVNITNECYKAGAEDVATMLGDVYDAKTRAKLMRAVEDRYGRLDYLISNHDFQPNALKTSSWNDTKALRDSVDSYLVSSVEITNMALPLLKRNRGYVAVVSSMPGKVPVRQMPAVAASKAALHAYYAALRQELKYQQGYVSVTSVTLGYMGGIEEEGGQWDPMFQKVGEIKAENGAWWAAFFIGGRKKEVTFPFAAQCHSTLYSWFPSFYENPKFPSLDFLSHLPFISHIASA